MSVARVACRAQVALQAPPVSVEVHLGSGLPSFSIVGLAGPEVKESKERVRAALVNSGFEMPAGRITVNLAPADLPKDGGRFDLAIALGILVAAGQLQPRVELAGLEFLGELGLGGELRPVRGALPTAAAAAAAGRGLVLPAGNAAELRLLPGLRACAAADLLQVCRALEGREPLTIVPDAPPAAALQGESVPGAPLAAGPELADICGQAQGKRALLVAAAGGHSLLFVGPPGCGKTLLAQRLPALLPPLPAHEALEVAMIASVSHAAGSAAAPWPVPRPFRAPHHSASAGAIVGGGARARAGEVTLAHRGVLFLDELPEFDRRVLEALREPLESGQVAISRAGLQAEYPARFQLVAAMNPCPCGHLGDPTRACRCPPAQRERYRARLSGPLLDRVDLRVALQPVSEAELAEHRRRGSGAANGSGLSAKVAAAQRRQHARQGCLNAALGPDALERHAGVTDEAWNLMSRARVQLGLSLRGLHRTVRVARSLADLEAGEGSEGPVTALHAAEALQLRRAFTA